jgi:hypothetical protein
MRRDWRSYAARHQVMEDNDGSGDRVGYLDFVSGMDLCRSCSCPAWFTSHVHLITRSKARLCTSVATQHRRRSETQSWAFISSTYGLCLRYYINHQRNVFTSSTRTPSPIAKQEPQPTTLDRTWARPSFTIELIEHSILFVPSCTDTRCQQCKQHSMN